jgi:hypothetical protein
MPRFLSAWMNAVTYIKSLHLSTPLHHQTQQRTAAHRSALHSNHSHPQHCSTRYDIDHMIPMSFVASSAGCLDLSFCITALGSFFFSNGKQRASAELMKAAVARRAKSKYVPVLG